MIRAWWDALQARERRMLGVGAVVVALLLGWALLWYPLAHARNDLEKRVMHQREDLVSMQQALGEARELHAQGARGRGERQGKSLLALADVTARGAGLEGALKRVEPTGGKSVRVSFEVANFDALMSWLDALVRDYGVQATDFSADKVEGLGLVNARATLEDSAR
ncbi:MAG: type II secretion system protein M [Rudaea sp.]|nr:type II secretion system protein M [Rudaea sp.]